MSIVAEACISVAVEGAINAVVGLLTQTRISSPKRYKQIEDEIKKWPPLFLQLQKVIHDAENKQISNPLVRNWLVELEQLVYDAEDIIEVYDYHVLYRQHQRKRDRFREYVSHPVTSLSFSNNITIQLKEITAKLSSLMEEKHRLDLLCGDSCVVARETRRPTVCLIGDECVYGRDEERDDIVRLLVNDTNNGELGVIPIVGMGGMGKTTLARYVFNDDTVVQHFDHRVWVSVSSDYDVMRISKAILEKVTSRACEFTELNLVQQTLQEAIKRSRFLLVLDDVWNERYEDWCDLRRPLTSGSRGSRIIITTRSGHVADATRTFGFVPLKMMNNEDCWKLFSRHAKLDEEGDSELKDIGRKISDKCKGLPLAAMVLGGFLRYKRVEDWEEVLQNGCEATEEGIRSVLRISYYELPSHLKRCFGFCATFPAAYEFKENDLVLIWLGLGLAPWEGTREVEDEEEEGLERKGLGHRYFRDLVSRSIFLPSSTHSYRFVMHDLVRDVAKEFSAMACCAREQSSAKNHWYQTRHLSFHSDSLNNIAKEIKEEDSLLPLRSFLHLNGCLRSREQGRNLDSILPQLKYLRLLSLHKSMDTELPVSIGKLTHLRYLDLSHNPTGNMGNLSASITLLYRLEILILKSCLVLPELPPKIGNLPELKYLNASFTKITHIPKSIECLKKLEYLILSHCECLEELPLEIGNLQSLRQLNIASTKVRELPSTITNVSNLSSLIVRDCGNLLRLPDDIGTLTELRHLDIGNCQFVNRGEPQEGIWNLRRLRYLSDYVAGWRNFGNLGMLVYLRGELSISGLENVGSTEVERARLSEKNLDSLTLKWRIRQGANMPQDATNEEQVLENLRPNNRVKKLTLIGYCGSRLPTWIRDVGLKELVLIHCLHVSIPPQLRSLY